MNRKEKMKAVRDRIVPIMMGQAKLEMMDVYKPGLVEPLGEATIGIQISTRPMLTLKDTNGLKRNFYAVYKVLVPLKPLIPVSEGATEVLQDHILTKVHASNIQKKETKGDDTLIIYSIDFWITNDGEAWHEQADGMWRRVLKLPEGLLQACILNLKTTIHTPKYIV